MSKSMTCMGGCGRTLAYPDAFPSPIYAVCWKCEWERHTREEHCPTARAKRRNAKRAAKLAAEAAYNREMKA